MLLKSLITPVDKVFLREDFDAVAGLRYAPPSRTIDEDDPWNDLPVSMSPQQIFDVLTQDLPGNPLIRMASDHKGAFIISIEEENGMYYDSRKIDFSRKEITLD